MLTLKTREEVGKNTSKCVLLADDDLHNLGFPKFSATIFSVFI